MQELLRTHPDVLPVAEIEPVFAPLIPVGWEVPVGHGYVDNLFISPRGYPVLVETKLWRNPEARREVVAQAIDYAAALSAWGYDRLDEAARAYTRRFAGEEVELFDWVERQSGPVEEGRGFFEEVVSKNLRLGRFLTLIVGDEIRRPLIDMVSYVNKYPLQDAVRFPAHNPNCWLMVIDDTAYFQPYTFGGQVSNRQGSFTIGHLMPVFKFRAGAREDIFSLLADHFDKLWQTTDTDLFHVGARVANGDRLIRRIFRGRSAWFRNVYGALYPARERLEKGGQERVSPRQMCRSPDRRIAVTWEIDGRAQSATYPIANFARGGVLLEVEGNSLYPDPGKVADLQIVRKPKSDEVEDEPAMSIYLKEKLIDPSKGKFVVLRIDRRHDEQRERIGQNPIRTFVALRANEEGG